MALNPEILKAIPYALDPFQVAAAEALERGDHVLVTAHTSAGKSTVALYALKMAALQNKRVFYTTPVKTLSNQKFSDLKALYGNDVGIQTGDVKLNPDAQYTVCTTEILRNDLFKGKPMDDVAFVVFDECHYINDPERGHVWEEAILKLPTHVQMVLLSATMANPEQLVRWIERIKPGKKVPIVSTERRPVPLKFSMFVPNPRAFNRDLPWDEAIQSGDLAVILEEEHAEFKDPTYHAMEKRFATAVTRGWDEKHRDLTTGRTGVAEKNAARATDKKRTPFQMINMLNPFFDFLHINRQLPAIVFVMSRKKCDAYAARVETCLVDHLERSAIEKTFDHHIRALEGHAEVAQVQALRKLLEKGVATHHSGMLTILKEIVEVLFTRGLIKVLFATETLAVGVNTPTKLVCFLDLTKHDGKEARPLRVEEFKQMAGRAGRRGLDTVGNVVYFPTVQPVSADAMRAMMKGSVRPVASKFSVSTGYVLRCAATSTAESAATDASLTLMQSEFEAYRAACERQLEELIKEKHTMLDRLKELDPTGAFEATPAKLAHEVLSKADAKRYDAARTLRADLAALERRIAARDEERQWASDAMRTEVDKVAAFLTNKGYLLDGRLTMKGVFANEIHQCDELGLTEAVWDRQLPSDPRMLAAWLAAFVDEGEGREEIGRSADSVGLDAVQLADKIADEMVEAGIAPPPRRPTLRYVDPAWEWCEGSSLDTLCATYEMFEGNVVRALQKLVALCDELVSAYRATERHACIAQVEAARALVARSILTTGSLYIT